MTNKRDILVAIVCTFCLTAGIFMIKATRSSVSSTLPYDPWIDFDENGRITMTEINGALDTFGSTGDPTKNVSVTNWPTQGVNVPMPVNVSGYYYQIGQQLLSLNPNGYGSTDVATLGFRKVTLHFDMDWGVLGQYGDYACEFYIYPAIFTGTFHLLEPEVLNLSGGYYGPMLRAGNWSFSRTYDVAFSDIYVYINNLGSLQTNVTSVFYLTA